MDETTASPGWCVRRSYYVFRDKFRSKYAPNTTPVATSRETRPKHWLPYSTKVLTTINSKLMKQSNRYFDHSKTARTDLGNSLSLNQIILAGTSSNLTPAFSKFKRSEIAKIKLSHPARRT